MYQRLQNTTIYNQSNLNNRKDQHSGLKVRNKSEHNIINLNIQNTIRNLQTKNQIKLHQNKKDIFDSVNKKTNKQNQKLGIYETKGDKIRQKYKLKSNRSTSTIQSVEYQQPLKRAQSRDSMRIANIDALNQKIGSILGRIYNQSHPQNDKYQNKNPHVSIELVNSNENNYEQQVLMRREIKNQLHELRQKIQQKYQNGNNHKRNTYSLQITTDSFNDNNQNIHEHQPLKPKQRQQFGFTFVNPLHKKQHDHKGNKRFFQEKQKYTDKKIKQKYNKKETSTIAATIMQISDNNFLGQERQRYNKLKHYQPNKSTKQQEYQDKHIWKKYDQQIQEFQKKMQQYQAYKKQNNVKLETQQLTHNPKYQEKINLYKFNASDRRNYQHKTQQYEEFQPCAYTLTEKYNNERQYFKETSEYNLQRFQGSNKFQQTFQLNFTGTKGMSDYGYQFIERFKEQIQLDRKFIQSKKWFHVWEESDKWTILSELLDAQYEEMSCLSIKEIKDKFGVTNQQINPFTTIKQKHFDIKTMISSYLKCQKHWTWKILHKYEQKQLIRCGILDLLRKGNEHQINVENNEIYVEDFVRFMNLRTQNQYRNRDLLLIYNRLLGKRDQRMFLTYQRILQFLLA